MHNPLFFVHKNAIERCARSGPKKLPKTHSQKFWTTWLPTRPQACADKNKRLKMAAEHKGNMGVMKTKTLRPVLVFEIMKTKTP